jgi:hypothetical protein
MFSRHCHLGYNSSLLTDEYPEYTYSHSLNKYFLCTYDELVRVIPTIYPVECQDSAQISM